MKERCENGGSHEWGRNADGFINESNGAIACETCGEVREVPLHGSALKRAVQMTGEADPETDNVRRKLLPGLGG